MLFIVDIPLLLGQFYDGLPPYCLKIAGEVHFHVYYAVAIFHEKERVGEASLDGGVYMQTLPLFLSLTM